METESSFDKTVTKVGGDYSASARNLLPHLSLRQYDLGDFQQELSSYPLEHAVKESHGLDNMWTFIEHYALGATMARDRS